MTLRVALIGGIAAFVLNTLWTLLYRALGVSYESGSFISLGAWVAVGYLTSQGGKMRRAVVGSVLAMTIDVGLGLLIVPIFDATHGWQPGAEPWLVAVIAVLVAAVAGVLGAALARGRRRFRSTSTAR